MYDYVFLASTAAVLLVGGVAMPRLSACAWTASTMTGILVRIYIIPTVLYLLTIVKTTLPANKELAGQGVGRTYKGYKSWAILPQVGGRVGILYILFISSIFQKDCSRATTLIIVFTAPHYFKDR